MRTAWPEAARVDAERMERPVAYCPVCRRPTPVDAGAGVVDVMRRLTRHLFDAHDPYFACQLRAALNAGPDAFYPEGDAI